MASTLTDVRVPAGDFPLGRILQNYPDVEIELERIVPTREQIIPLFWIQSGNEHAVEDTLETDPLVEEIVQLTRTPDRILYSVTWSSDINALVRALVDLGIDVLSAEGTSNFWEFRLQFEDRDQLSQFRRTCQAKNIDLELLRVYNPQMPPESGPLTPEQRDALTVAYEEGYWDIPRGTTQQELADLVGISDNSLSQRLRRGTKIAVADLLYGTGHQQSTED
ncbi:MAG: helix-turn-helix domain-containing protein [Salinirussus sp.]